MSHVDPSRTSAAWTTVVVTVPPEQAELAADVLWQAGAAAIEEQAQDGAVVLLAGYEDEPTARQAAARAEAAGHGPVVVRPVEDDGRDAWRAFARVERAGRFWLVPAWLDAPAEADPAWTLRIDPGPTFGSGSHPTTRLVVADLERLVVPGRQVLDVGCGSGVLAIAAARLGATGAVGVDVDPEAPAVTAANAEANGVAHVVRADARPLAAVVAAGERFDVVAANLLAPTVVELAPDLVRAVAPEGRLVVSGLLADRWEDAIGHLAPLQVASVHDAEGWVSVVLTRPGTDHAPDSAP